MKPETAEHAVKEIMRVNRLHRALIESRVKELSIHPSQHRMLMYLTQGKCTSQKQLAEHFGISAAAVTGTLQKLEVDGYIRRNELGEDNRINEIEITESGRLIVERSRVVFSEVEHEMFAGLDESEVEKLITTLERVKSNLNELSRSCNAKSEKGGDAT